MPEGLKLKVSGDIKDFEKVMDRLVKEAKDSGNKAGKAIADGLNNTRSALPALSGLNQSIQRIPGSTKQAEQAVGNFGRILQDLPFGMIGVANNIVPFIESLSRASAAAKETGTSLGSTLLKSLTGGGGLVFAFSAITSAMSFASMGFSALFRTASSGKQDLSALKNELASLTIFTNQAKDAIDDLRKSLDFRVDFFGAGKGSADVLTLQIQQQEKLVQGIQDQIKLARDEFNNLTNDPRRAYSGEVADEIEKSIKEQEKALLDLVKTEGDEQLKLLVLTKRLEVQKVSDRKDALKKSQDDYDKFVEDTIGKAKELADFLNKQGIREFKFEIDPRLKREEIFAQAQRFLSLASNQNNILQFRIKPDFITDSKQVTEETQAALLKSVGLIKLPDGSITVDLNRPKVDTKTFADYFKSQLPAKIQSDVNAVLAGQQPITVLFPVSLQAQFKGLEDYKKKIQGQINDINQTIYQTAVNGISSLADGLGQALAGGNIGEGFMRFATIIADGLSAIGKQMIAYAPVIEALKTAIQTLNPAILLPAGIALVAIGGALKASVGRGVKGFAEGGLVYGPTMGLVGEGVGTTRSNPEVIAPLDQLRNMIAAEGGGGVLRTTLRGNDLALAVNRTNRRNSRLGG